MTATATATATVTAVPTADAERGIALGEQIGQLIRTAVDRRHPIQMRFMGVIRHAEIDPSVPGSGAVVLSVDKVTWNVKYSDGNDEDPVLNPTVKWEKVRMPAPVLLVIDGASWTPVTAAEFVAKVNHEPVVDGWRTPYQFYFVGGTPVAVGEHYVP